MLERILTPSLIARIEGATHAGKPLSDGDKLGAYVSAVQAHYDIDTRSVHWTYARHFKAREDGMASLGEIVDYLRAVGVGRFA